jgi:anti-sigma factor RsiW
MTNAGMTCREGVQHLADYTDGVLDPDVRTTLEAHVSGCARCTAFVRSYTAVPAILRQATSVTLSAEGQEALRRALARRRG